MVRGRSWVVVKSGLGLGLLVCVSTRDLHLGIPVLLDWVGLSLFFLFSQILWISFRLEGEGVGRRLWRLSLRTSWLERRRIRLNAVFRYVFRARVMPKRESRCLRSGMMQMLEPLPGESEDGRILCF